MKYTLSELNLKGNSIISLISAILGLYVGFAAVAFFGATAPIIKEGMGLTPSEVGLLVAIPTLTGGLLRIPGGAWADANGGKKPILIFLILTLIGLGSFAIIASIFPTGDIPRSFYPILLICGALTGCGIGVFTAGIAHVSYWFPRKKQGTALGIYSGVGGISSGIVTAIIPIGLYFVGFKGVYIIWFLFVLISTLIFVLLSSNSYYFQLLKNGLSVEKAKDIASTLGEEEFPKGNAKQSLLTAIKNGKCWALTVIYFSTFGGSLALTSWLPSFWTAHHGLSLQMAGIITGISSALSPFMRIFGGALSDKFRAEYIGIIALLSCFIGGIILSFGVTPLLSGVGIFIMVAGIGVSNAAVFKLVPEYVTGAVGGASGIIGGVGAMGGFIIPPILGWAVTAFGEEGYSRGFIIYCGLFLICIVVMAVLTNIHKKTMDPQ